jgi:SET domain-containing protein
METLVVRHSPIHGRGVFAARRIEAGEVIIDGCRDVLSDEAEAGEEITVDYAAEHVPGPKLPCNCQAPTCRGFIVPP